MIDWILHCPQILLLSYRHIDDDAERRSGGRRVIIPCQHSLCCVRLHFNACFGYCVPSQFFLSIFSTCFLILFFRLCLSQGLSGNFYNIIS